MRKLAIVALAALSFTGSMLASSGTSKQVNGNCPPCPACPGTPTVSAMKQDNCPPCPVCPAETNTAKADNCAGGDCCD